MGGYPEHFLLTRALLRLKFRVWEDYEKKNRVPHHEVQKMAGRPIRPSVKIKLFGPGKGLRTGPFRICFGVWIGKVGMLRAAFFFGQKNDQARHRGQNKVTLVFGAKTFPPQKSFSDGAEFFKECC